MSQHQELEAQRIRAVASLASRLRVRVPAAGVVCEVVVRAAHVLPIQFLSRACMVVREPALSCHGRNRYPATLDDMLSPFPPERLIVRLFCCHLRARMAQMGVRTTMAAMRASQSSQRTHPPIHACATRTPWPTVSLDPTRPAACISRHMHV